MKRVLLALLCLALCLIAPALAEEETATYAVLVVDEAFLPVAGVRLTVSDPWDDYPFYTDAEGHATIELPAYDGYTLRAYPPLGYAIYGPEEWPLRPSGESRVLLLEQPELIVPRDACDVPWPEEGPEGEGGVTWQDDAHGALVMSLYANVWVDGRLTRFTERIGQVVYSFDFTGEAGEEVLTGCTISQAASYGAVFAAYDAYGHLLAGQAGDLSWSDHVGWYDRADGPVDLPEDIIDVVSLGPLTDAQPWPVPRMPVPNAPAIPPRDLPRIVSTELRDGQLKITLDIGLDNLYGAFDPEDGILSARFLMEDGSWVPADQDSFAPSGPSQEERDVWFCDAPEGALDVAITLRYRGIFYGDFSNFYYESEGDGTWLITFDEGDMRGAWTYAEDGTITEATYTINNLPLDDFILYDFLYEPGTNRLLTVRRTVTPSCSVTFDGEGRVIFACCDDGWLGTRFWMPEQGWVDVDGNPVPDHHCPTLGDPAAQTCPIDLDAPQVEIGWYYDSL